MKWLTAITLCMLSGCAQGPGAQQTALLKLMANRPLTCTRGADCDAKWDSALAWVNEHSETGVKTATDKLIATNMEKTGGRDGYKYPEFTVLRYAKNKHTDVITFTSYCEHGFECGANGLKFRAGFANAVIGLPPGVIKTGPDSYFVKNGVLDTPQAQ